MSVVCASDVGKQFQQQPPSSVSPVTSDARFVHTYRTLLRLVHLIAGLVVSVVRYSQVVVAAARRFVLMMVASQVLLVDGVKKFKKVPVHLAFVVDDPNGEGGSVTSTCMSNVASLVAWCATASIRYVTLYDHKGLLRHETEALQQCIDAEVSRIVPKCRSSSNFNVIVLDSDGDGQSTRNNNLKNLGKTEIVHVQVMKCLDGRQDLVDSTRRLAELQMKPLNGTTAELVVTDFIEQMQSNRGFPCPDVLICCGETYSTIGFLPWHIHLTEIFYFPTYRHMTLDAFHAVLSRFDRCEQRLGK